MKKKPDYYRLHPVLSFRVPLELKTQLKAVADADGRPISQWLNHYMIRTLEELVEEHQDSPPPPSVEYVRKKHVRRQTKPIAGHWGELSGTLGVVGSILHSHSNAIISGGAIHDTLASGASLSAANRR